MKRNGLLLAGLVISASFVFVPRADAQLLWRWFGPKTTEKPAPVKATQADPRRVTEVNVEVAWLADPVTFPYYLEAKVVGSKLEVRGYVPNKSVRDSALKIAQVYSSLPVTDSMKEHPSLQVKTTQMSAQQLQTSAQSSLRAALPKQHQQLKVECGADGKIFVLGNVNTLEEKAAVSSSLRRLHGCTSVQNLTTVAGEIAQSPPLEKTPGVKTSNPKEMKNDKPSVAQDNKSKSWWPWNKTNAGTTTDEPPLLEQPRKTPAVVDSKRPTPPPDGPILVNNQVEPRPIETKKPPEPIKVEPPMPKSQLSGAELRKRIQAACPQAKSVEVEFAANMEVRIMLEIRAESELTATAERIFAMPELQSYRPELQFRIAAP